MNFIYKKQIAVAIAVVALAGIAQGQNKVKTITIINGDTTISESTTSEKDVQQMEKDLDISINDDGKQKTIVKKIVIKTDGSDNAEAMAYTMSDGKDDDVIVTTGEDGTQTKIIINKDDDDKSDAKDKKVIIKKSAPVIVMNDASGKREKEKLSISIQLKNTTATVEVASSSKLPLNISILDENGKQVFYDSQKDGGNYKKEIPLKNKGTYFLNLIQDKKSTTEKIVVE
ncbi:MAG: hypothetical protein JWP12_2078 [Bacteroidetes bacterium]|nr:hypothetical protein [Bacteroidota bacterium]